APEGLDLSRIDNAHDQAPIVQELRHRNPIDAGGFKTDMNLGCLAVGQPLQQLLMANGGIPNRLACHTLSLEQHRMQLVFPNIDPQDVQRSLLPEIPLIMQATAMCGASYTVRSLGRDVRPADYLSADSKSQDDTAYRPQPSFDRRASPTYQDDRDRLRMTETG